MSELDNLKEKGQNLVDEHGEQAGQGLDKAGDLVDQRTGGEHSQQIDSGVDKAKDALDNLDQQDDDIS